MLDGTVMAIRLHEIEIRFPRGQVGRKIVSELVAEYRPACGGGSMLAGGQAAAVAVGGQGPSSTSIVSCRTFADAPLFRSLVDGPVVIAIQTWLPPNLVDVNEAPYELVYSREADAIRSARLKGPQTANCRLQQAGVIAGHSKQGLLRHADERYRDRDRPSSSSGDFRQTRPHPQSSLQLILAVLEPCMA